MQPKGRELIHEEQPPPGNLISFPNFSSHDSELKSKPGTRIERKLSERAVVPTS